MNRFKGELRYGCWAGDPDGTAEDKARCQAEIARACGRATFFGQCGRKRGHGKDGLYCKQHGKMRAAIDKEKM